MANLKLAGESGALDTAASIAEFKAQIAVLNDLMRQVAGSAAVSAGATAQADPLSAPFTLYVNPYTGSDRFVGGAYNSYEVTGTDEEVIASKLKRLELQRLECGYTPQRPFKTINRAVIEAAIITSKDWYTYTDPRAHVDCVSIILAPGVHTLYNDPGSSSTSLTSWGDSKDPTTAELIEFNPATVGGVLLPRGCSLCGPDLRKTTIRPSWVPSAADEASDYSNRRGMLKVTGTGYFFGFTFMDKVGLAASHHLLDPFQFGSEAELDDFYAKVYSAVGTGADLSAALTVTRGTEHEIVGPIVAGDAPTSAWDTTASASPYVFNCSVRSDYGMCGIFADGSRVGGLKSLVTANFTGVSLQKDMSCWEVYSGGNWVTPTYEQYITAQPDDVRMKPARRSRHITAINDAFIQEVSVFAIGHGIHHFTDLGGEITITNSNSSFGGCAAISKGYKSYPFPQDENWTVSKVRVPLNISEKTGNKRRIYLGTINSITSSVITLDAGLATTADSAAVPAILYSDGYSLPAGTKIWVENPRGDDWRTTLDTAAWDAGTPDEINVTGALQQSGTDAAPDIDPDTGDSVAVGKRVYIRRLVDTRTPGERRVSLRLNNTASARIPERNFVLQTDPNRAGGAVARELTSTGDEIFTTSAAGVGPAPESGVARTADVLLRRAAPSVSYANGTFYRGGTTVKHSNKHYQALSDHTTATASPDPSLWSEIFVHMESAYNAEDPAQAEYPVLILDTDTSDDADSTTLGINFSTVWTSAGAVRNQYRSASDYLGVHAFLVALGFTATAAHNALVPQAEASRDRDPASAADFPVAPTGGAASGLGNWAVEFRRPSILRLYGHAWEWAGYLNYSKAVPAAQQTLSAQNKFTYYFTSSTGGRVVPQGSNEDGFNVSPRGLEDVETGATLTVTDIGTADLDSIQQTDFPNGLTASELTVDNLIVTGTATLPAVGASTTAQGGVGLADIAEIRSTASLSGTTDTQLNAAIDADSAVVTKKALEYWRTYNRLVSARTGTQYVYVDPVNGRTATTEQLLADPPTSGISGKPVKTLVAAAAYANSAYSPTETVEFRLAPGLYVESGEAVFKMIALIRAWDYSTQSYLNTTTSAGSTPFTGANHYDSSKQPTFLTQLIATTLYSGTGQTALLIEPRPLRLVFEQEGRVTGVAWWGVQQTLYASAVPDSFFLSYGGNIAANRSVGTNWRALAIGSFSNAFNYYLRAHAVDATNIEGTAGQVYGIRAAEFMRFYKEAYINNVSLGAIAPADVSLQSIASNTNGAAIRLADGYTSYCAGLALMGNVRIDNSLNTGSYSSVRLRVGSQGAGSYSGATYELTGFSPHLFSGENSARIGVVFGTAEGATGTVGTYTRNYNNIWSNVRLFNTAATPAIATSTASAAGSSAYWRDLGPAFSSVFDYISEYSVGAALRNWTQSWVSPTGSSGFEGVFGNYNTAASVAANLRTTGLAIGNAVGTSIIFFGVDTSTTIFRVAGAGTTPTIDTGVTAPGGLGNYANFDALNVRVRTLNVGIDVTDARSSREKVVF